MKLETSYRTTLNAYIRTYSNAKTTVLTASPKKSEESVKTELGRELTMAGTEQRVAMTYGVVLLAHSGQTVHIKNKSANMTV
jgi:hypothetical protein